MIAYRQLLRAPGGTTAFRRLLGEARPAGQLYALCGLRELEPDAAPALATTLLADERPVTTLDGCEEDEVPLQALVARALDDEDEQMVAWRAGLRGGGRGWREGAPPEEALRAAAPLLAALPSLAPLDRALGNGPPPPWSATEEARATGLDEESARRRDEHELGHVLSHLSDDPLDSARYVLASRLAACGPLVVPALTRALRDPAPAVRIVALIALHRLGAWADESDPALAAAVNDPDVRIRWFAIHALAARRGPVSRAGLLLALGRPDEESELLANALNGLAQREPEADAAPVLVRLLAHRHPQVAHEASTLLRGSGH